MPTTRPSPRNGEHRRERQVRFSQNFLHSRALVERLVARSSIGDDDVVIEIGPGNGIITDALAGSCGHLLAIEKDPHHATLMQERYRSTPNVTIFAADFLEFPLPATPYKVFANIPFNITAAIVGKLTTGVAPPADAFLVMQREAAERFTAGTLQAVTLAPWFEVSVVHHFRRADFQPMPRVECDLLRLTQRGTPHVAWEEREAFDDLVTSLFTAWKPTVVAALATLLSPQQIHLVRQAVPGGLFRRPAETPPESWIALHHAVTALDDRRIRDRVRAAARQVHARQARLRKPTKTLVRTS